MKIEKRIERLESKLTSLEEKLFLIEKIIKNLENENKRMSVDSTITTLILKEIMHA